MAFKEKFKTFLEESKTKILNNEEDSLGVILPTEVRIRSLVQVLGVVPRTLGSVRSTRFVQHIELVWSIGFVQQVELVGL